MSRIGMMPIAVAGGVEVVISRTEVSVKGPKGSLTERLPSEVSLTEDGGAITVERRGDSKRARSMHGLVRSLVSNMVEGVSRGFERKLTIVGVGYRAEVEGKNLVLNLGYSDPISYPIPEGIEIEVETNTRVTVAGASKQTVGQVSAEIRSLRPPEPYKGKGVRYADEIVHIKPGKTGAV